MVAVTPISLDMTSRTDLFRLGQMIAGEVAPPAKSSAGPQVRPRRQNKNGKGRN